MSASEVQAPISHSTRMRSGARLGPDALRVALRAPLKLPVDAAAGQAADAAGLRRLLAAGAVARLALLLWAAWQDATMAVKYTDIDYEASHGRHCSWLQHHIGDHSLCGSRSLRGTAPAELLRRCPYLPCWLRVRPCLALLGNRSLACSVLL